MFIWRDSVLSCSHTRKYLYITHPAAPVIWNRRNTTVQVSITREAIERERERESVWCGAICSRGQWFLGIAGCDILSMATMLVVATPPFRCWRLAVTQLNQRGIEEEAMSWRVPSGDGHRQRSEHRSSMLLDQRGSLSHPRDNAVGVQKSGFLLPIFVSFVSY